jgi:hypothetical protein
LLLVRVLEREKARGFLVSGTVWEMGCSVSRWESQTGREVWRYNCH